MLSNTEDFPELCIHLKPQNKINLTSWLVKKNQSPIMHLHIRFYQFTALINKNVPNTQKVQIKFVNLHTHSTTWILASLRKSIMIAKHNNHSS